MDGDLRYSFYDNYAPPSPRDRVPEFSQSLNGNTVLNFGQAASEIIRSVSEHQRVNPFRSIPPSNTFHSHIPSSLRHNQSDVDLPRKPRKISNRPIPVNGSLRKGSELSLLSCSTASTSAGADSSDGANPSSRDKARRSTSNKPMENDASVGKKPSLSNSESTLSGENNSLSDLLNRNQIRQIMRQNRRGRTVEVTRKREVLVHELKSKKPKKLKGRECSIIWTLMYTLSFTVFCTVVTYFFLPILFRNEEFLNSFKRNADTFTEIIRWIRLSISSHYDSDANKLQSTDNLSKNINLPKEMSPYNMILKENTTRVYEIQGTLMSLFESERIRDNLRRIAADVHVAGTPEQLRLMDMLRMQYENMGYNIDVSEYNALLSYPDYDNPNTIDVWSDSRQAWHEISAGRAQTLGDGVAAEQQRGDRRAFVWWNAYAANGSVSASIVYVNYGTREDYDALKKIGITVRDRIALARHGALFRGEKVYLAQQNGAVGLILYGDPYDFAPKNSAIDGQTFPDGLFLPKNGAQRGTLLRIEGDPETPGLPSLPYVYRSQPIEELRPSVIPAIPVTSIGYGDALKIFRRLNGSAVSWSEWRGSMNVTYSLEGSETFRLNVRSTMQRRRIKNFLACFRGHERPDEWVLLGNHADAWGKGAIDPGTGTATMLEIARVLKLYSNQSGWRPRRTICFCQWDAEEFGLIGSTEWVEEHLRLVEGRVVAYVNVDHVSGNGTLDVKASPLLYRALVDAASIVPHPQSFTRSSQWFNASLIDAWRFYAPKGPLPGDRTVPTIQSPVGGSDFQPFIGAAGVAVADIRMESAPLYSFMLYHTMYELPWTVERLVDPDLRACTAVGKMWLELGRNIADSMVIPFNVEDYAVVLIEGVQRLDTFLRHIRLADALGAHSYREKMNFLRAALLKLHKNAIAFQLIVQEINSDVRAMSLYQLNMLNSRLRSFERCFLMDRNERSHRPSDRHAIFGATLGATSENAPLGVMPLAAILRPTMQWLRAKEGSGSETADEVTRQLTAVRRGFSYLQYSIESATLILKLNGFYH